MASSPPASSDDMKAGSWLVFEMIEDSDSKSGIHLESEGGGICVGLEGCDSVDAPARVLVCLPPEIKESPRDVAIDCARDMIVVANVKVAKVALENIVRHRLVTMRVDDR